MTREHRAVGLGALVLQSFCWTSDDTVYGPNAIVDREGFYFITKTTASFFFLKAKSDLYYAL